MTQLRQNWLSAAMAGLAILFAVYIAYAEAGRFIRRSPPPEYRPPVHPVSLEGAEWKGSRDAPVIVLVYSDFICPACARFALETLPTLEKLFVNSGKVAIAMRHLPVGKFRSLAPRAAEAAYCAGRQGKFWQFYEHIYRAQLDREYGRTEAAMFDSDVNTLVSRLALDAEQFRQCLKSDGPAERVASDAGSALMLGVESTPSILIGVREESRLRVMRHLRGRPRSEVLVAAVQEAIATAER
jgi:predicted DsbA family dithiol-disulfide isomerase